jgi:hypothetical protein
VLPRVAAGHAQPFPSWFGRVVVRGVEELILPTVVPLVQEEALVKHERGADGFCAFPSCWIQANRLSVSAILSRAGRPLNGLDLFCVAVVLLPHVAKCGFSGSIRISGAHLMGALRAHDG